MPEVRVSTRILEDLEKALEGYMEKEHVERLIALKRLVYNFYEYNLYE